MKQGVLTPGRVRLLLHRGSIFFPSKLQSIYLSAYSEQIIVVVGVDCTA